MDLDISKLSNEGKLFQPINSLVGSLSFSRVSSHLSAYLEPHVRLPSSQIWKIIIFIICIKFTESYWLQSKKKKKKKKKNMLIYFCKGRAFAHW